jgi:rubrerythrin
MDFFIDAVFEEIEKKEKEAHEVYKKLAKMLTNPEDKKNILMLADQELAHDNFFSGSKKKSVADIPESTLKNLAIFIKDEDPSTITSASDLIDFAIREELRAEESYRVIAEHLPDEEGRQELLKIAEHEKHHAKVLQRIKSHL